MSEKQIEVKSDRWQAEAAKLATEVPHYRIIKPNWHHLVNAVAKGPYKEITDENLDDVIKFLRDRVQPELDHDAPMLPEAPASWNLTYYVGGRREQITLRGMTYAQIESQAKIARAWIAEHADEPYIPGGNGTQPQQKQTVAIEPVYEDIPNQDSFTDTPPTEDDWQRGEAQCMMITLGTSYSGGKPQLLFDCDGMEYPLRYTKSPEDMKTLLKTAQVSKPLVAGEKWKQGGAWTVEWASPPPKEPGGKRYRNVQSVTVSAA